MPKSFQIFFKTGERITMEIQRFRVDEGRLTLYRRYDEEVGHAFVSFDDVSAIVSNEIYVKECKFLFKVHLREHEHPIEIPASAHRFDDSGFVQFYYDDFSYNKVLMDDVWIRLSEVLAIVPIAQDV
jgi:hypothetical protein